MEKITIGLVGCGWIGLGASNDILRPFPASHAAGLMDHGGFELIGLHDPAEESKTNAKNLLPNIPFYANLTDLFAMKPKAIVIASSATSHCKLIEACLKNGVRYILCEKPLAENQKDAEQICRLVKDAGTQVVINHMRRFSPELRRLRSYLNQELIRDTITGKIVGGHAYYDKGLYHCGTHIIDLLTFFLGPVTAVSAINSRYFQAPAGDLCAEALLDFKDCQISLKPFASTEYAVTDVVLYGQKGRVTLKDMWGKRVELTGTRQSMEYSAYRELDEEHSQVKINEEPYMRSTYAHFYNTILGGVVDDTLAEALHTMRVMKAISESCQAAGKITTIRAGE